MRQNILLVLGVVFILVGILGFVNNPVVGIFAVNSIHNLVHLVSGILAVIFARMSDSAARRFSQVFGIVYLLVAVLGFIMGPGLLLGLVELNMADNFLHVVLAAVFLWLGFGKPAMMMSGSSMGNSMNR
jgi:hypothetical protein